MSGIRMSGRERCSAHRRLDRASFVAIDLEHSAMPVDTTAAMAATAGGLGLSALVRDTEEYPSVA